jgi:hypothetical protein
VLNCKQSLVNCQCCRFHFGNFQVVLCIAYSWLDATRARVFWLRSWLDWWGPGCVHTLMGLPTAPLASIVTGLVSARVCPHADGSAHCTSGAPVCSEIPYSL